MEIWVDTDFGFDDLWALLLLRHLGCPVAGVSLVAGNTGLHQVTANAMGGKVAYRFHWPVWQGSARPMKRDQETAERILGTKGMRSRGEHLPVTGIGAPPAGAIEALRDWLGNATVDKRTILALGPLTNIAGLLQRWPDTGRQISRLVWMGGSSGRGNHTAQAEFNAVADPEALYCVLGAGVRVDIVDLEFCRTVTFNQSDLPETDRLTGDLLRGYLDIALERGRAGMAIYDPIAALAVALPDSIEFTPCTVKVSIDPGDSYGATRIEETNRSITRIATRALAELGDICLSALKKEAVYGSRQ